MLLLIVDTLLVNGAILLALRTWAWVGEREFALAFIEDRWFWFPLLTVCWWLIAWIGDLYELRLVSSRTRVAGRILVAIAGLDLLYLAAFFFSPRNALPRLFFLYFSVIVSTALLLWRWAYIGLF
jgi:hypothetical protein